MGQDGRDGGARIDPERLEVCLAVLAEAEGLHPEHPDSLRVQRATARLFKEVKLRRRRERRQVQSAADAAVLARTATAAPDRIDDETRGAELAPAATGASAGVLHRARPCYICKEKYTVVDAFYHQLCPDCAAENRARRDARTDLSGRRALLTGGRAKIGMYIALRLLRDGAHTTITTRFPNDAARRFAALADSPEWLHRLRIVGIDLRDPAQVTELADTVAAEGPLDVLINNAAQTVRRSAASYALLAEAESAAAALPASGPRPETLVLGSAPAGGGLPAAPEAGGAAGPAMAPEALTALALTRGSAAPERIAAGTAVDAGGLVPDLAPVNSWTQTVGEVDPVEMLEVQLCNVTAPFVLVNRLRPALAASPARRAHVVNVSAMEGVFGRGYKGAGHPHTNMAKASLNMLTRTSAEDMFADGILMNSVDTGWITDERPHPEKVRLAAAGVHAPLDLVDGAARVYDPIVRGEAGEDVYGCFLKDYRPSGW
ncbi:SDR family NAD(P)-dependent oxidoreductase [Nocardiopsis potens]|uniref:SDR family NAD(P)-dependent oxidoreductase n=1 Tax=Nocardiopsis potens TaxID=1246458 RepID=UPI00034A84BD|nr:SDR family NAD(P)-dependent oxidoreductase [Nocardiopsis potens]